MDRDVILQGLSVLLGVRVSPQPPHRVLCGTSSSSYGGLGRLFRGFAGALSSSLQVPLLVNKLPSTVFLGHGGSLECGESLDFLVDEEGFFDPKYHYDFQDMSDPDSECERGGEPYKRPVGWYRVALKVWDKYDGMAWLGGGKKEWRNQSVEGEWPVAYHGTTFEGAKGIIEEGFKAGPRAKYGRGVYCTPDIYVAERDGYAKTFTSKKDGKTYKVALQGRVNPNYRKVCDDENEYWLIPVPKGTSAEEERDILDRSIRPYGMLFKKV